MKKTQTSFTSFLIFLCIISFFGNNVFAQKTSENPTEKEIFKTTSKIIKNSIKEKKFEEAINECDILLKKTPSMQKEVFSLKYQIAKKAKKEKVNIYQEEKQYFIAVFNKKKYFFVDNQGNEITKLGKWHKAETFNLTESIFADVHNEKNEKHLLDTAGNSYLLAESISELKAKDKKCTALKLKKAITVYDPSSKYQTLGEAPLETLSNEVFKNENVNIFEQTQLKVLIVNDHKISEIPNEIGNLVNLVHLDFSTNQLSNLPSSFENLSKLNYIDLGKNNFSKRPEVLEKFAKIPFLNIEVSANDDEIYMSVDGEKADFPGGYKEFQKFIRDNYEYPRSARRSGAEGTISIQFIVEKDGSVSDVKVLRGVSPDCDAEAVRVIKKVLAWKPARIRGRAVRNRITLPIKLKLG